MIRSYTLNLRPRPYPAIILQGLRTAMHQKQSLKQPTQRAKVSYAVSSMGTILSTNLRSKYQKMLMSMSIRDTALLLAGPRAWTNITVQHLIFIASGICEGLPGAPRSLLLQRCLRVGLDSLAGILVYRFGTGAQGPRHPLD